MVDHPKTEKTSSMRLTTMRSRLWSMSSRSFLKTLSLTFLALCLGIALVGYFYLARQKAAYTQTVKHELDALADLKTRQISTWYEELLQDTSLLMDMPWLATSVQSLFDGKASEDEIAGLRSFLESMHTNLGCTRALLVDTAGQVRIAIPEAEWLGPLANSFIEQTLLTNKVMLSDFHMSPIVPGFINMDLFVPILPRAISPDGNTAKPIGVVMFEISPKKFIFPTIKAWPIPHRTGETLLLRRESNDVVFLNDPRLAANASLKIQYSVTQYPLHPASMAVSGRQGVVEGVDYNGTPVVASLRAVAGTPWFIVVKIDKEEVYTALQSEAKKTALLVIILLALAGLGMGLLWRQHENQWLRSQLTSERERLKAEEGLRESEGKIQSLFDAMTEGVALHEIINDKDGKPVDYRILDVNPAFEKHTGLSPQKVTGMLATEIYGVSDAPYLDIYARVAKTGQPHSFETYAPYMQRYFEIHTFSPKRGLFATVFEDVTSRRSMEKEIRSMNERLEQRVRERTEELAATNSELEIFIDAVSHDLRSPLQIMLSFSELLSEDYSQTLDPKARTYLQHLHAGTIRLNSMLDGLLDLSRSSRTPLRRTPVDIGAMANEVVDDLRKTQPDRHVLVAVNLDRRVRVDERLLRSLLSNLIGNAWKYTGKTQNARIELGVNPPETEPVFFVRDNGPGFDMNRAEEMFAPFKRLHSDSDFAGTGMGLATAKRIVTRHGGRIWAEGEPGKGATFYFTLGQSISAV